MRQTRTPATRLMVSLPLLLVTTALVIALVAGSVATLSFYAASRRTIEANLSVLAHDKRSAVEALLSSVRQDLANAAGNPLLERALDNIGIAVKIMPAEARAALATTYANADERPRDIKAIRPLSDYYGRAFDAVNPGFKALAAEGGYPDILFIDRDGNVAYSLARHTDFGAQIHGETLRGSVLGDLFDRVSTLPVGATLTTDFRPYAPAGGPAAFVGAPVYQQVGPRQEVVGVLAFALPRGRIDAILNDPVGFGAAGEAVLVGPDGLLRSNSRFGTGADILRRRYAVQPIPVTDESHDIASITTTRGMDMLAAAVPIAVDDLRGSVVAAESTEEMLAPVRQMVLHIGIICLAVTLLLALVAVRVSKAIARPVLDVIERFDSALSNMQHGVVMVDREEKLILCNTTFAEMYALPPPLAAPGTPLAVIDARVRGYGPQASVDSPIGDNATGRYDLSDGRIVDVVRRALPSGGFVATHQNITTAVHAQRQIHYLATHDALTGLPNRASLLDRMAEALERVRAGDKLAVLCLDLDYFKAVNDMYGHPLGDALLRAVAARLAAHLTGRDILTRIGGDELVILQSGVEKADQARLFAERLIAAITRPFDLDGHHIIIGLSVGIALAPTDGTDGDTLLKKADLALYRAKADGRGSCRFFEPGMDARLQVRRQLELDLRHAVTAQQFEIAYQPVYDTMTEAATGAEALLRWRHPERGMVSPGEFIPLAEEMGLIVPIGEWVLRRACLDAAQWPEHIRVAVNLSTIQLKSPDLVATVLSALNDSGLSPLRLELEITESVLLSDDGPTLATLRLLKGFGIRIAMDDFGTGYSSLSYLRSFPFDKIKIDQSFVRELGERAGSIAIIKTIAELATILGMSTTVEGVETVEQLHLVRKQGCTEVQGYLMCRPIPAAQLGQMFDGPERRRLSA